jgi:Ca-activated chloride channel family protein
VATMRLAAAALLAALALATPVAAAEPTPVVGGGSFNAAPILAPGTYSDTVLPAEYIYYAIRVGAGQRVQVSGATDIGATELLHLGIAEVWLTLHSPTRMDVPSAEVDISKPGGASFTGPPAQVSGDSETDGPWAGPGVYFLSVQALYRGSAPDPPRAEIPFHFTVSLQGAVQPTPTPTPVRTPTPKPTPTPAAASGGGTSTGAVAGVGVAGLLIGLVVGLALRARRR